MLLLEQDITRKRWVDENATQLEFEANDNKKYKVKDIRDSAVYAKLSEAGYLPELYYLLSWKSYSEQKDT